MEMVQVTRLRIPSQVAWVVWEAMEVAVRAPVLVAMVEAAALAQVAPVGALG